MSRLRILQVLGGDGGAEHRIGCQIGFGKSRIKLQQLGPLLPRAWNNEEDLCLVCEYCRFWVATAVLSTGLAVVPGMAAGSTQTFMGVGGEVEGLSTCASTPPNFAATQLLSDRSPTEFARFG